MPATGFSYTELVAPLGPPDLKGQGGICKLKADSGPYLVASIRIIILFARSGFYIYSLASTPLLWAIVNAASACGALTPNISPSFNAVANNKCARRVVSFYFPPPRLGPSSVLLAA